MKPVGWYRNPFDSDRFVYWTGSNYSAAAAEEWHGASKRPGDAPFAFDVADELADSAKKTRLERGDPEPNTASWRNEQAFIVGTAAIWLFGAVVVVAATWLFLWSSVSVSGLDCGTVGATWIRPIFGSNNGLEAMAQGACRAEARSQTVPAVAAVAICTAGYFTFRGSKRRLF